MDDLARLIGSLSKSEKRYFRLFSDLQAGEKDYLRLFEAVEKLGDYEEEKIRKQFAGEDFLKRLPAVKSYLSSQILKSLRVISSGHTVSSKLNELIDNIGILFEKRLFKQCRKTLEKAKDLALQNELPLYLVELLVWEERLLVESVELDELELLLQSSLEEETRQLDIRKNAAEYRHLYNRIQLVNKRIKEARTEDELSRFSAIREHPLLRTIDKALSFDAKNYFYGIHLIYFHAKGDNHKCLELARKQVELIESYPDTVQEHAKLYLSALNNILLCQIHLHNYSEFDLVITKLRAIPLKSITLECNRFVTAGTFEMVRYLDTGDFQKSVGLRKDLVSGLLAYADKINPIEKITLLYNLFYSYFGTGDYSKALEIINQLLNRYQKELRYDVQGAVRILNIILHFELGNNLLLQYNAVSTYRFLAKSKRLYKLETVVLNFIRKKMRHLQSPKAQLKAFVDLRTELLELENHPFEKKALEYFDYISWLDSKIENRSFEEVVKAKFQRIGF